MANETTVILTNYFCGEKKEITKWTSRKKRDFLRRIRNYDPKSVLENEYCFFRIYHDKNVLLAPFAEQAQDKPVERKPCNTPDELIIEMTPNVIHSSCPASCYASECNECLAKGKCTSPFIKTLIGKPLFPELYKTTTQGR